MNRLTSIDKFVLTNQFFSGKISEFKDKDESTVVDSGQYKHIQSYLRAQKSQDKKEFKSSG